MNKRRITIIFNIVVIVLAIIVISNPLRKSQEEIHNKILASLSPKASIKEVKSYILNKKWKINYEWEGVSSEDSKNHFPEVDGNYIIGAYLGHYWAPLRVDVEAYWGFNSDEELIDLNVRKTIDGL